MRVGCNSRRHKLLGYRALLSRAGWHALSTARAARGGNAPGDRGQQRRARRAPARGSAGRATAIASRVCARAARGHCGGPAPQKVVAASGGSDDEPPEGGGRLALRRGACICPGAGDGAGTRRRAEIVFAVAECQRHHLFCAANAPPALRIPRRDIRRVHHQAYARAPRGRTDAARAHARVTPARHPFARVCQT